MCGVKLLMAHLLYSAFALPQGCHSHKACCERVVTGDICVTTTHALFGHDKHNSDIQSQFCCPKDLDWCWYTGGCAAVVTPSIRPEDNLRIVSQLSSGQAAVAIISTFVGHRLAARV